MKSPLLPVLAVLLICGSLLSQPASAGHQQHYYDHKIYHELDRHSRHSRHYRNEHNIKRHKARYYRKLHYHNKHYYHPHRPIHSYGHHSRHKRYYRDHDHVLHNDAIKVLGGVILLNELIGHH